MGRMQQFVSRSARHGEDGFTLAELVVSIAILAIIGVSLGAAFTVTAHDSVGVADRLSESHDAQISSA